MLKARMRGRFGIRERLSNQEAPSEHRLTVTETRGAGASFEAILRDLSDGGLAMDCGQYLRPNTVLRIEADLPSGGFSMRLTSSARVVSCRRLEGVVHRIGVEFLEAEYRPVAQ